MPDTLHEQATGYADIGDWHRRYEEETGDRPAFLGYDARYDAWAAQNDREALCAVNAIEADRRRRREIGQRQSAPLKERHAALRAERE